MENTVVTTHAKIDINITGTEAHGNNDIQGRMGHNTNVSNSNSKLKAQMMVMQPVHAEINAQQHVEYSQTIQMQQGLRQTSNTLNLVAV